jgi:hypothetical protein
MGRLTLVFAAFAFAAGLALSAAVWMRTALRGEYERGAAFGRAQAQARADESARAAAARAQSHAARTQAALAGLEDERDRLQERMDDLEREAVRARTQTTGSGAGDSVCLDPSLVRALDAIGRSGLSSRACP